MGLAMTSAIRLIGTLIFCTPVSATLLISSISQSLSADIVIDPEDSQHSEIIDEQSLVGYRALPLEHMVTTIEGKPVGIPIEFFFRAAKKDPRTAIHLERVRVDSSQPNAPSAILNLKDIWGNNSHELIGLSEDKNLVPWPYFTAKTRYEQDLYSRPLKELEEMLGYQSLTTLVVDAAFAGAIINSELVGQEVKIIDVDVDGKKYKHIRVDPKVVSDIAKSYDLLSRIGNVDPEIRDKLFNEASKEVGGYEYFESISRIFSAPISYGEPTIYEHEEKGLRLPKNIERRFDVYWVEFAVTIREINPSSFEEIAFYVALPKGARALELIPLVFGAEMAEETRLSSPEITLAAGDRSVSIGTFFERSVAFKTLKPTIIAGGLQENLISWTMRGEAIDVGAKRFIAIVGVPTEATNLDVEMAMAAKTSSFLGLQGNYMRTRTTSHTIPLK